MAEEHPARNSFEKFVRMIANAVDGPVTWFRESVVEPNRPKYYYYHREFKRVPTIDQCYRHDVACMFEANEQFKRDRSVDQEIVQILRQRKEDCILYEQPDYAEKCQKVFDDYEKASENYFIKYGDLGFYGDVIGCYMKQKHRMVWERRHGPVGTGKGKASDKAITNDNED